MLREGGSTFFRRDALGLKSVLEDEHHVAAEVDVEKAGGEVGPTRHSNIKYEIFSY